MAVGKPRHLGLLRLPVLVGDLQRVVVGLGECGSGAVFPPLARDRVVVLWLFSDERVFELEILEPKPSAVLVERDFARPPALLGLALDPGAQFRRRVEGVVGTRRPFFLVLVPCARLNGVALIVGLRWRG